MTADDFRHVDPVLDGDPSWPAQRAKLYGTEPKAGAEPQTHCSDCDRPAICDIIKRGTAPCGRNAGMGTAASDLYLQTEEERRRLTAENAQLRASSGAERPATRERDLVAALRAAWEQMNIGMRVDLLNRQQMNPVLTGFDVVTGATPSFVLDKKARAQNDQQIADADVLPPFEILLPGGASTAEEHNPPRAITDQASRSSVENRDSEASRLCVHCEKPRSEHSASGARCIWTFTPAPGTEPKEALEEKVKMAKLDAKFYGEIRKVKDDSVVPDDEYMVFLAKDNAFAATLPFYRDQCVEMGADEEHIAAVDRTIARLDAWRSAHPDRLKVPDAKGEKLLA